MGKMDPFALLLFLILLILFGLMGNTIMYIIEFMLKRGRGVFCANPKCISFPYCFVATGTWKSFWNNFDVTADRMKKDEIK